MQHQHNSFIGQLQALDTASHLRAFRNAVIAAAVVLPALAMAQAGGGDLASTTCGFFNKLQAVLNAVSIVVVTIAIIFSGYQIAFAHKRISDIAPVFIGALLIGAATQIAKLFLAGSSGGGCGASATPEAPLTQFASIVQALAHYA